ncbi:hypothetical protein D3C86_1859450 [compost metagenome]
MRELSAHGAQAFKRFGARVAQSHAGICEFKAATFLGEQTHTQVLFQHFQLTADGTMGHVQLFRSLTDAV